MDDNVIVDLLGQVGNLFTSSLELKETIDFMLKGGMKNPNRDEKLKANRLSAKDRKALQAFLQALTGTATYTKAPELP